VPQTSAGQIRAIGRVDHNRTGPRAEGAPAQGGKISHELIPRWPDKVDKLQLEHWALAVGSEPAGHTHDGGFGERRVVNLLREFGRKFLRKTKNAALRIFHVFAEDDPIWIPLESEPKRFVDGVSDAVFAGREDLVVQLRQLSRDLDFQLVR
jgi:hypothetical protein